MGTIHERRRNGRSGKGRGRREGGITRERANIGEEKGELVVRRREKMKMKGSGVVIDLKKKKKRKEK